MFSVSVFGIFSDTTPDPDGGSHRAGQGEKMNTPPPKNNAGSLRGAPGADSSPASVGALNLLVWISLFASALLADVFDGCPDSLLFVISMWRGMR